MKLYDLLKEVMTHGGATARLQGLLSHSALEAFARHTQDTAYGKLLKMLVMRYAQAERKLSTLNNELLARQAQLDKDLWAAAQIQRSLLPQQAPDLQGLEFSWRFEPNDLMGGDLFNLAALGDDELCCYLLDVSGHGVPAALVTVSVAQMLQPSSGLVLRKDKRQTGQTVTAPRDVVAGLAKEFPVEKFDKTFSIFYMVIDIAQRKLRYCNAGHPDPILVRADGGLELLNDGGAIIGFGDGFPYDQGEAQLRPGDKLILYSDGLTEHEDHTGIQYGQQRLQDLLAALAGEDLEALLDALMRDVSAFGEGAKLRDDLSLLACKVTS